MKYTIPFFSTNLHRFIQSLANIHFKGDKYSDLVAYKIMIMAFNSVTNGDNSKAWITYIWSYKNIPPKLYTCFVILDETDNGILRR